MLRSLSSSVTRTPSPATASGRPAVVVDLTERRTRRTPTSELRITPELLAALAGSSSE